MSEHKRGEGEKAMHVRPTRLASHDKLWISLFSGIERCETVFVIIMKIIIMMIIIMMVIKREKKKKLTADVTLLPRTLTLLNSCTWALDEGGWHLPCLLVWVLGFPVSGDKHPSSSRKLMPLVTLLCTFSPQ